MTVSVTPMSQDELDRAVRPNPDGGFGALLTDRGNLPLDRLDVQATISGLIARTRLTAEFVNVHDAALEATYVFPLPDRAAVTGMTMTADGRTVEAELQERAAARETYDNAVAAGQRASIAEEERPDVFTMRVGNILPGERVSVELSLAGRLPYEDGAATFRFPLVVAPRYIPGVPVPGPSVGDGHAPDTDAVPDASRITPPVLLPGFPNPLRLSIGVDVDPAGLSLGEVRSSLHTVTGDGGRLSIAPGERADRDFVLRLAYAEGGSTLVCVPDGTDEAEGTYQLTVLPPAGAAVTRPRDVVLLLDRSGSMGGWSMVAARRAAARIVDTLTADDRFTVLTFDDRVEHPADLGTGLVDATDRHRYRAVEHLARVDARGGTEMLAPLRDGLRILAGHETDGDRRDRVLVLVTDGQVGNEDQILREITPLVGHTRIHAVGIDRSVNAGFLGRLAALGAGRCELVESEDRLDEAMEHIQRRIGAPVVADLSIDADGIGVLDGTRAPVRLPGIYPGVPLVVAGRYTGPGTGTLTVRGRTRDGRAWDTTVTAQHHEETAVTAQWARSHLRDLEDRYAAGDHSVERKIVDTSLRFKVLCRFTAYVAVDARVVTDGGKPHRVVQPVELPSGWTAPGPAQPSPAGAAGMMLTSVARIGGAPPLAAPGPVPGAMPRMPKSPGIVGPRATLAGGAPETMMSPARHTFMARPATGRGDLLTPLREVIAMEVRRLIEADRQPAQDQQDQLADLASRLDGLLFGQTDPAYQALRDLAARLRSGGDVTAMRRDALQVLEAFLAGTPGSDDDDAARPTTKPDRTPFWKR